jgi:hypothetical protein
VSGLTCKRTVYRIVERSAVTGSVLDRSKYKDIVLIEE